MSEAQVESTPAPKPQRSQHGEENIILDYFKTHPPTSTSPRFLDIGAANINTFSNVGALIELGWGGILVEPSPYLFPNLIKTTKDNPKLLCINAAVSQHGGLVEWFDSGGDFISTMDDHHRKLWEGQVNYLKFIIPSITAAQLLDFPAVGRHFDFVNVDVEGLNAEILAGIMKAGITFDLLCVESEPSKPGSHDRIVDIMAGYGSRLIKIENVNLFFTSPTKLR